jgi:hypothetical protein
MPVKPSSPTTNADAPASSAPNLSKKTKFWIGLSLAVVIPVILGVFCWLAYRALFPNNPRLIVNSIRLAGNSGYWSPADPDERQARLDRILSILRIRLGGPTVYQGECEEYPFWGDGRAQLRPRDIKRAEVLAWSSCALFLAFLAFGGALWLAS